MASWSFDELARHAGHRVVVVTYGSPPETAAAECETCCEVLVSFSREAEESDEDVGWFIANGGPREDGWCEIQKDDESARYETDEDAAEENFESVECRVDDDGFHRVWARGAKTDAARRAVAAKAPPHRREADQGPGPGGPRAGPS